MARKEGKAPWPRCTAEAWDGQCRSTVAPAAIVAQGQKAEPHPSALCPAHLKQEREAEDAAVRTAEPDDPDTPAVFTWGDDTGKGRPWRERLRADFDQDGVYEAFRQAIVSGLTATKGVSKACKCGRAVNVTLPDAANITRAARDILSELEGVQKDQPAAAKPGKNFNARKATDAELEAALNESPFDETEWQEFQAWRRRQEPKKHMARAVSDAPK